MQQQTEAMGEEEVVDSGTVAPLLIQFGASSLPVHQIHLMKEHLAPRHQETMEQIMHVFYGW